MSEEHTRILVVGGAGGVGKGSHLPAIASLPAIDLAGVVDVSDEALRAVSEEYGCPVYMDLQTALDSVDVDVVDICSPDFAHAEQALQAARSGKHVLCEKPLALTIEDALAIREAARASKVKVMVAQVMRYQSRWRSLQRAVAEGRVGSPVFGRFTMRGAFFSYPANSFYRTPESLGEIVHNGMHYFDTLAWILGTRPAWVSAEALEHYPLDDRLPGPNYWNIQVGFESGALGHIEANLALDQPRGVRAEQACFIVGTQGTISSDGADAAIVEQWDGQYSWPASWPSGVVQSFADEIEDFVAAVRQDGPPSVGLDWSIRILEACLACLEAVRERRRVDLVYPEAADRNVSELAEMEED
ncbi:MAG: Gfo/Idh/MocA family protein [Armatimonadota bacterium]